MEISPVLLLKLLFYAFLWGIAMGVLNDINRISRALIYMENISPKMQRYYDLKLPLIKCSLKEKMRLKKKSKWFYNVQLFLQDFFLVLVYILGLIFLNYSFNKGDFRFFTIISSLVGGILYYFTIGKMIFSLSEFICFVVKAGLLLIFYVIFSPFVYILTKIQLFFEKNYIFFQNSIAKYIKKSYNVYKEKELMRKSLNAFFEIQKSTDKKA